MGKKTEKIKKAIAWYKQCLQRCVSYAHFYYIITLTALVIKAFDLPSKWLFLLIPIAFILIWIIGSWDLKHIYPREMRIAHKRCPVLMEILNGLKEILKILKNERR